jgi:hypothetical protein
MQLSTRTNLERQIAEKVVRAILDAGMAVSLDNGGDEYEVENSNSMSQICAELCATDEEHIVAIKDGKRFGSVYMVYGNDGYDSICDYSLNLETILAPVQAWAETQVQD